MTRDPREQWAYRVTASDWPTDIGTGSNELPHDVRYGVLRQIPAVYAKAMRELAQTPVDEPDVTS